MNRSAALLVLAILIGLPGLAWSQKRGEKKDTERVRCVGKLKGIAPGVLQVETEKGERMLVAIEPRAQEVSFVGEATPAFVQAGMLVQFSASLDKKGEAQEKINQLKVVSPKNGIQVGLQAEGGFAGGELFASGDDDGKKKKKSRSAESGQYQVTGTVRSIKDGKMYVAAGAVVKAELAENCQVSLEVSDIRLAREGDNVEADGWRYPNQATQMYANRVNITAEKPLGVDEKKRRPTTTKEDDKKSEEKPKAGADKDGKKPEEKPKAGAEKDDKEKPKETKKDKS